MTMSNYLVFLFEIANDVHKLNSHVCKKLRESESAKVRMGTIIFQVRMCGLQLSVCYGRF